MDMKRYLVATRKLDTLAMHLLFLICCTPLDLLARCLRTVLAAILTSTKNTSQELL
jgi:hypothetical protein